MDPAANPFSPPAASITAAEPGVEKRPPFPMSIRIAAVLWFIFGGLLASMAAVFLALLIEATDNGGFRTGWSVAGLGGLFFAGAGLQTWRGRVTDVRGIAAGSLVTGLVIFLLYFQAIQASGRTQGKDLVNAVVVPGGFVVAGGLAFAGRDRFLAWRRWKPGV